MRVVNVIDLLTLFPQSEHPHGMMDDRFDELFTRDRPVVFAFHKYQRAVHQLVHGRPHPERFHVRGFNEQGTTTTPFDMVVLNKMSRYDLAILALLHVMPASEDRDSLVKDLEGEISAAVQFARDHFEDPSHIRGWTWSDPS